MSTPTCEAPAEEVELPAVAEPTPGPGAPRRTAAGIALATALMFGIQFWLGLWQQINYDTAAYDLGLFSQEVSGWAYFHLPRSTLDVVAHHDALGEHFSPILAVLGPFWRMFPTPVTLLAAQALLLALSLPPVVIMARRRLGGWPAAGVAVSYMLSWELSGMSEYQFHELAFAVPLIAWSLERLDAGRWRSALVLAGALLLVKEDMALVAAGIGLLIAIKEGRRVGVWFAAGALAWFLVAVAWLLPVLGQMSGGGLWPSMYSDLAPSASAAPGALLRHPSRVWAALTQGGATKLHTIREALEASFGLALVSPIALLSVPVFLSRFVTTTPSRWGMQYQYNAILAPILIMALVDGLARLTRYQAMFSRTGRAVVSKVVRYAPLAVAVVPFLLGSYGPIATAQRFGSLSTPSFARACNDVVAATDRDVPANAVVEATSLLTPHLVGHLHRLYLPNDAPVDPSYLVVQAGPWDSNSLATTQLDAWVRARTPNGYTTLASSGTCSLLHVNGSPT